MGIVGRLDQYASMLAGEFDDYSMSENFVSYSTYFASNWTNIYTAGATLTTGITAPDGTNTAIRFTCNNTTNALLRVTIPSLTPNGTDTYTSSFYVRKISGTGSALTDLGDGNPNVDYSSQLVTNQWVRVTASGVPTATAKTWLDLFSDNNTNYVLDFWGVQLERGSVATDYTPTRGSTVTRVLPSTTNTNITGLSTYFSSGFSENVGAATTLAANVFPPYDLVYDDFGGTLFGAGQGRYMRQNTDKSVIVYNEIDEVSDFYSRGVVRAGLVLDLDAGLTSSYPGTGATWTDLGVNGLNATLVNSPTYSSSNQGYLSFASASSQYATATNPGSLSRWTVETVVRFTAAYNTKVAMVVGGQYNGASSLNFTIGTNNAPTNYNIAVGFFDGAWRSTTGILYPQNTWVHITGTYDGSTIRQFTNGNQVDSLNYVGTPTSGGEIRINRRWDDIVSSGNLFDSNIAMVRIYNRALTAAEIKQNYDATKGRFGL